MEKSKINSSPLLPYGVLAAGLASIGFATAYAPRDWFHSTLVSLLEFVKSIDWISCIHSLDVLGSAPHHTLEAGLALRPAAPQADWKRVAVLQGVDPDATAANQRDLDSCHAVPAGVSQSAPTLALQAPTAARLAPLSGKALRQRDS
ncbi:exported hypothetical protein [Mesorhizobium sp. ORS 3359]|nr:exported hypothetical protein [Mesorhizobium sp. ORS 3359]